MPSVKITVNGQQHNLDVEDRTLLVDALRESLGLTGTHIGCDTSQCGCCTVLLDGNAIKSCTALAAQVDGSEITTIEGLAPASTPGSAGHDELHPVQQAFSECHALQCGFCTPGMVMATVDLLKRYPNPDIEQVRKGLEGNLCRCTGYINIERAVLKAASATSKQEV